MDHLGEGELTGVKKGPTQRKGRRKIEIKFIADKSRRHITFSKRKAGIMKKVSDLRARRWRRTRTGKRDLVTRTYTRQLELIFPFNLMDKLYQNPVQLSNRDFPF